MVIIQFLVCLIFENTAIPTNNSVIYSNANTNINSVETVFDSQFDNNITQFMQNGHITSLALSISKNDAIYWTKEYGNQPEENNVYMIGSMTKSVTATAILQLLDRGQIDSLDDNINDYLDFVVKNPKLPNENISIRQVLSHRAGMFDAGTMACVYIPMNQMFNQSGVFFSLYNSQPYLPYPNWVREYFVEGGLYYNTSNWLDYSGEFLYSNCGFILLGYLIQHITGQTLEKYFFENIFEPLGMDLTHMYLENYTSEQLVGGNIWIPEGYENEFGLSNENSMLPQYDSRSYGAGSLHSTAEDMSKFLIAQAYDEYNGYQILDPSIKQLMHSNQGVDTGYFRDGEYGFGWMLQEREFTINNELMKFKTQGHGGNSPYFWALMMNANQILPDKTLSDDTIGLVLLVNQGYNIDRETLLNFPEIFDFILQYAFENLIFSSGQQSPKDRLTSTSIETSIMAIMLLITLKINSKKSKFIK